jgi:hypothetical protein
LQYVDFLDYAAERLFLRKVGGGLHKLEPKELANVPAAEIAALLPGMSGKSQRQVDLFRDSMQSCPRQGGT